MQLATCKLCGRVFVSNGPKICENCMRRLEEVYSRAHDYLRNNDDENFDAKALADAIEANPRDVQELIDMGWLERDIQTYKKTSSKHYDHLQEFNEELESLKAKTKLNTYGGMKYDRNSRYKNV